MLMTKDTSEHQAVRKYENIKILTRLLMDLSLWGVVEIHFILAINPNSAIYIITLFLSNPV